jgi:hypothetical protein
LQRDITCVEGWGYGLGRKDRKSNCELNQNFFFKKYRQKKMVGHNMSMKKIDLNTATPTEKMDYYRKNSAGFSIGVGVLTLVVTPLLPLIFGVSYKSALIDLIISGVLGVAFLALGIWFYKKDSRHLAKVMIGLFVLYIAEKVFQVIAAFNAGVIVWIVLAVMQIIYLIKYLRIEKTKYEETLKPTAPPAV